MSPPVHCTILLAGLLSCAAAAVVPRNLVLPDQRGDNAGRRTDPGGTLAVQPDTRIDVLRMELTRWQPDEPDTNPFDGQPDEDAPFFRLDVVLAGLVAPPGPADPKAFDPFRYGERPIYGFIEIDMDRDRDTGGELDAPEYRYLGNLLRFGGDVTDTELIDRVAMDDTAFDGIFTTPPFVERSGEEFHLALLGGQILPGGIEVVEGNANLRFDEEETWRITGSFFHRAHGYERFSLAEGGRVPGEYAPVSILQFVHDDDEDETTISLVFPLTNEGAARMRDEPVQPTNPNPSDQASVLEGLEDLELSAFFLEMFPTGLPEQAIINGWAERNPTAHLNPADWSVTALVGTSYSQPSPQGVFFLWTDVYPNVVYGDVDGSGARTGHDRQIIAQFIADNDAADGRLDDAVAVVDFAVNFHLYDINQDGIIDGEDLSAEPDSGDADIDGDVDLRDFAALQRCFHPGVIPDQPCEVADLNEDLFIDLDDARGFHEALTGPDRSDEAP